MLPLEHDKRSELASRVLADIERQPDLRRAIWSQAVLAAAIDTQARRGMHASTLLSRVKVVATGLCEAGHPACTAADLLTAAAAVARHFAEATAA